MGRAYAIDKQDLILDDFNYVEKLSFPAKGSNKPPFITPPHPLVHTFKFKSYAPRVFRRVRDFFGINAADYMVSVCGKLYTNFPIYMYKYIHILMHIYIMKC